MDEVRKASSLLNASAFADCAQLNAMDSPEIFGEHKTNRTLALRARISFVFVPIYSKSMQVQQAMILDTWPTFEEITQAYRECRLGKVLIPGHTPPPIQKKFICGPSAREMKTGRAISALPSFQSSKNNKVHA